MSPRRFLYASHAYSTHDERFIRAASEDGWEVFHLRFDGTSDERRGETLGFSEIEWLGTRQPYSEEAEGAFVDALTEVCRRLRPLFITGGPLHTIGAVIAESVAAPYLAMSLASDVLFEAQHCRRSALNVQRALSFASGVIVDCETVKAACIAHGAEKHQITVVPWGVDLDAFPYASSQNTASGLNFLSLRNHEAIYDLKTLIYGFGLALTSEWLPPESKLVIAGSGTLTGELKSLAESTGMDGKITFRGQVPESDLSVLLRGCDLHVSTSLIDGTSVSLLQAMATGRPSIVADIPSNREWVNAKCGWRFEAGSAVSLAEAFRDSAASRARHDWMGVEARAICEERADWSRNYVTISRLYDSFFNPSRSIDSLKGS